MPLIEDSGRSNKLDIDLIRHSLAERERLILEILYETGCKVKELVDLKVKDIKKDYLAIKDRNVKVSNSLINGLAP
jgi:site-specific recombinase XerD